MVWLTQLVLWEGRRLIDTVPWEGRRLVVMKQGSRPFSKLHKGSCTLLRPVSRFPVVQVLDSA